ncbi:hypothetical protein BGZ96_010763 [Linnemannia gamsii]|uniref:Secreted protein n=1 Tax=Linnemannia gamsii TaxID=64522 RepID=A0ABQ7JTW1_9FUNG|nr:hypothetical protein BGZ96_010763 [Linnemannia gamsii]
MRILSLSVGLAAVTFVAVQAADPLAATGAQNNYEWAPAASDQDLAAQVEDLSAQVAEIEFRASILSRLEQEPSADFKAEGTCDGSMANLKTSLSSISGPLSTTGLEPYTGSVVRHIQQTNDRLISMISGAGSNGGSLPVATITFAIESLVQILEGIASVIPLESTAKPILQAMNSLQESVAIFSQCGAEGGKITIEPSSCFALADIYRGVIQDAAGANPALNLPTDAPQDLRRLASGSLTILDLISKYSIAATNEALLASRPMFAADILDQYRTEMIRVTTSDEIKGYAVASLGTVVGVSNALEACLRVAADPVAAIDELNEELEAQALYDEYEDEDDDDDEDEE